MRTAKETLACPFCQKKCVVTEKEVAHEEPACAHFMALEPKKFLEVARKG